MEGGVIGFDRNVQFFECTVNFVHNSLIGGNWEVRANALQSSFLSPPPSSTTFVLLNLPSLIGKTPPGSMA
ncbi:hypothetical protein RHGRI_013397 [Rhododendron griersonianum]|uniref:Uncharacterized protein n=1 Tax=Rhododendron griersonianum TaxID=479676 RepID=A0AAV6K5D4_9ERIC|nr:hypothetical protein RHGRI_013397 [Rhododendron griersonianum]